MKGLGTAGINELDVVERRVRRLYGLGRLTLSQHDELMDDLDRLKAKFRKYHVPEGVRLQDGEETEQEQG